MHFEGLLVGLGTFLIIGLLHPVVIKAEYAWGKGVWPAFAVAGAACVGLSLGLPFGVPSILAAVLGFSLWWSIRELFEQEQRVRHGWYPANPRRRPPPETGHSD